MANLPNTVYEFGDSQQSQQPVTPAPYVIPEVLPPCVHRGTFVETQTADLCGFVGTQYDVFACSIHGLCAGHRMCRKQPEAVCSLCDDRDEG